MVYKDLSWLSSSITLWNSSYGWLISPVGCGAVSISIEAVPVAHGAAPV